MSSTDSTSSTGGTQMFSPVSLGRISGLIVEQIRLAIRNGQLVAGSGLPSERQLCTQFGVSRVTVREALRVLEASGLIEIRVGARGGAFVTAPTSERVSEGITDLLAFSGLTAAEVTEARRVLELSIVPIVCERATVGDVADLLSEVAAAEAAIKRGSHTMDMSAAFHVRLAEATHNRAIAMLAQSFREPMLMSMQRARAADPAMGARGVAEHRSFVEAIRDRDVQRAQAIMAEHLDRTAARVAEPVRSLPG